MDSNEVAAIIEGYKIRADSFKTQGDRLWIRFNYFLGIEAALFGMNFLHYTILIQFIGIIFSIVWYLMASNDRFHYSMNCDRLDDYEKDYVCKIYPISFMHPKNKNKIGIFKNNIKLLSVTNFAVIIPILSIMAWSLSLFNIRNAISHF